MSWRREYSSKLDPIGLRHSFSWWMRWWPALPSLRDVEIIHMKTLGSADYTRPSTKATSAIAACSWARMCARRWRGTRRLHADLPERD
jgi:hypothetical protein